MSGNASEPSSTRAQRRVRVTCPWVDRLEDWVSAFPLETSSLVVFGESLASDPRVTMDAVAAFLHLDPYDWDDRILHAHVNTAAARGPSALATEDGNDDAVATHASTPQPMQQTFVRLWPFHSVCARRLAALTSMSVDGFPDEWRYLFGRSI